MCTRSLRLLLYSTFSRISAFSLLYSFKCNFSFYKLIKCFSNSSQTVETLNVTGYGGSDGFSTSLCIITKYLYINGALKKIKNKEQDHRDYLNWKWCWKIWTTLQTFTLQISTFQYCKHITQIIIIPWIITTAHISLKNWENLEISKIFSYKFTEIVCHVYFVPIDNIILTFPFSSDFQNVIWVCANFQHFKCKIEMFEGCLFRIFCVIVIFANICKMFQIHTFEKVFGKYKIFHAL